MSWIRIGEASEIPVVDMRHYAIDDVKFDVSHPEDGWYATSDMCTHQDCSFLKVT